MSNCNNRGIEKNKLGDRLYEKSIQLRIQIQEITIKHKQEKEKIHLKTIRVTLQNSKENNNKKRFLQQSERKDVSLERYDN